ncbi:MAG TPA: helix-turn-helix domain-containing protein [Burkholderiaceae bacterium]|nr:helix-turn-helix domain-containing protein [Burkholderiaceae bacterium]
MGAAWEGILAIDAIARLYVWANRAGMTNRDLASRAGPQVVVASSVERMRAIGRVHVWPGGSLWIGRGHGRGDWHSHHALQIALPLDGTCRFRSRAAGTWEEYTGAIVHSHRHHQFEADGVTIAQIFVEPETTEGRALRRRFTDDICALPDPQRAAMTRPLKDAYRHAVGADAMVKAARAATALLAGASGPGDPVDTRVTKAIDVMRARMREDQPLADVAAAVALSPSRFRHLFVQETGTSFRAYLLWLRLHIAIQHVMAGDSWTDAAHEAGFADSSHLHRTFKRMFGLSPTSLVPQ